MLARPCAQNSLAGPWGWGLRLQRGGLHTAAARVSGMPNRRRDDRLEAYVESLGNHLGDSLKIFSKWYNATALIAADYLTSRRSSATKNPHYQRGGRFELLLRRF